MHKYIYILGYEIVHIKFKNSPIYLNILISVIDLDYYRYHSKILIKMTNYTN